MNKIGYVGVNHQPTMKYIPSLNVGPARNSMREETIIKMKILALFIALKFLVLFSFIFFFFNCLSLS